uniref:Uncharacterized protein n=1 Tax=Arundo donax TaxID=35708 RepID=A0A0A9HP03_ARUDO
MAFSLKRNICKCQQTTTFSGAPCLIYLHKKSNLNFYKACSLKDRAGR